jgi:hypothetical protein
MILYETWQHFWWLRRNGSSLLGLSAILPSLICTAITIIIQEYDLQLVFFHPYAHQVFSLAVTFLLTYRSQLAYQRFWEARTNLQAMSSRWMDAANSFFLFDDLLQAGLAEEGMKKKREEAEDGRDAFRGKLLHLMSMMHCFACLHLMRNEHKSREEMQKEMPHLFKEGETENQGGDENLEDPLEVLRKRRPAFRQYAAIMRSGGMCSRQPGQLNRYKLGIIGDVTESELHAMFPPEWEGTTSHEIQKMMYDNHELRCCGKRGAENDETNGGKLVDANLFDRVSLVHGWVLRLVGRRRREGGLGVPDPVLSRAYHLITEGTHQGERDRGFRGLT